MLVSGRVSFSFVFLLRRFFTSQNGVLLVKKIPQHRDGLSDGNFSNGKLMLKYSMFRCNADMGIDIDMEIGTNIDIDTDI